MARIARVIAPGIPHQITQRGNRRQQSFFCDDDIIATPVLSSSKIHGSVIPKKINIKIYLVMPVLISTLFFACGSTVSAPQAKGKPLLVKNEGISSAEGRGCVGMRVLWTVSGYKMGSNPLWGEKEARSMLFKPLDITASAITFDGKTCRDVTFEKETLNRKEYLASLFHAKPQRVGIAEEVVEVVTTNCDLPGFDRYLRLRDRRLVIYLNGVFFYLEPNVNY
jgi:hypothetical protein